MKQVGDKKTETGTTDRETDKETLKPAKEKETEQQYTYKKPAIPAAKEPAPIADTKTSSTPPAKAPPKLKKPFSKEFETDLKAKRDAVRGAFQHAWKGYKTFAWGEDELLPLSKKGRVWFNLGLTIIDALDTAWIMGEKSIFKEARDWVGTSYSLKQSTTASVFETTIRVLGGLLSTYALTEDKLFLKRATEVGDTLLKAFESKSGIPYMNFDFAHQQAQGFSTSLADCGTLSLEFKYLSHVTGDEKYWNAVQKISKTLFESPNTNGLLYTWANVKPFGFIDQRISIGSGGDSYYECVVLCYLQRGGNTDKDEIMKVPL